MNDTFNRLFSYWCMPYKCLHFPEHLQGDLVQAYGEYAFEEGFRLAVALLAPLLTQNDFDPYRK